MMSVVRVENLTKKFGKFTALDQVNFEVNKGEIFGFIGPNGAGKSTTIRVLLGVLKATEGRAVIFEKDAWKEAVEIHRRVAYVPGDVNLWPNLTGGEIIDLFIKLNGTSQNNRKEELIQRFGLDPSKKSRTYSKGNRQKIALIAALASEADLYIFDEPTSGLDPLMEKIFQEYVIEAKAAGKSILLSSHILSEVEKLCDRVGIIREGKIIEVGSLKEMRHLTRTHILLETKRPAEGLSSRPGVHDVKETENGLSFQVDTEEMPELIQFISTFGVVKLESAPPALEDLFMRHYAVESSSEGTGDGGEE